MYLMEAPLILPLILKLFLNVTPNLPQNPTLNPKCLLNCAPVLPDGVFEDGEDGCAGDGDDRGGRGRLDVLLGEPPQRLDPAGLQVAPDADEGV